MDQWPLLRLRFLKHITSPQSNKNQRRPFAFAMEILTATNAPEQ